MIVHVVFTDDERWGVHGIQDGTQDWALGNTTKEIPVWWALSPDLHELGPAG